MIRLPRNVKIGVSLHSLFLYLSLSLSLRHLGFMTMEGRKTATPTREKGRKRIRVSFGRVSSSSPGFTCFTSLRSLFTRGTITTIRVINRYVYLTREDGREEEERMGKKVGEGEGEGERKREKEWKGE